MARSKILISFNEVPFEGDELKILEENLNININEIFKEFRLSNGECKIPPLFEPDDEFHFDRYIGNIVTNYANAFNLDYNSTSLFTVTKFLGTAYSGIGSLIIEAKYDNAFFMPISVPSYIDIEFFNQVTIPAFNISSLSYTSGLNVCQNVTVNVQTSVLTTKILQPIVNNSNTDNPFSFEILRGIQYILELEDANGQKILQTFNSPSLLNASNFNLQINNSPNGATVIVNNDNTLTSLTLEYSLNNSTWQTSNVFSGLDVGDYTVYIKDQFGCTATRDFNVNEFGLYVPYFYISKSNSFRFANRITWGDSANYKTDENTLSCEVDVRLPTTEIQRFQSADIIPTQFKSNYATNTVTVLKSDGNEVNIPVTKKSNNIGLKDKRDARKIDLGNGKTGVYFISGNIYDYDTNGLIDTYTLNGLTPEWAQIGNYLIIGTAWYLIEDVIFDESRNADIIVFSDSYSGPEINVVVGSIYNRFNYEVYEFTIDMNAYIDQKFRIKLENTDPHFVTISAVTEIIWCKVKHDEVLEMKYWNTTNTDIFYSTGIQHLIRIPYISKKGKSEGNSEVHKTDTDAILLNGDLYEADEIQFQPVTREIWRKLMIALTHEELYINGVKYVRNGDFNTEGPLGDTDDYVLTAPMLKRGTVYNSQTSGNLDFNTSSLSVPGLIETDSGFVKY